MPRTGKWMCLSQNHLGLGLKCPILAWSGKKTASHPPTWGNSQVHRLQEMKAKEKRQARAEDDSARQPVPRASLFGTFGGRLYLLLLLIIIPGLTLTVH